MTKIGLVAYPGHHLDGSRLDVVGTGDVYGIAVAYLRQPTGEIVGLPADNVQITEQCNGAKQEGRKSTRTNGPVCRPPAVPAKKRNAGGLRRRTPSAA